MAWTNVNKPTGQNWTGVSKPTNPTWTGVVNPSESSVLFYSGGEPIGLLLALTKTVSISSSIISGWTGITKPSTPSWTSVTKPTTPNWTNVAKPTP